MKNSIYIYLVLKGKTFLLILVLSGSLSCNFWEEYFNKSDGLKSLTMGLLYLHLCYIFCTHHLRLFWSFFWDTWELHIFSVFGAEHLAFLGGECWE